MLSLTQSASHESLTFSGFVCSTERGTREQARCSNADELARRALVRPKFEPSEIIRAWHSPSSQKSASVCRTQAAIEWQSRAHGIRHYGRACGSPSRGLQLPVACPNGRCEQAAPMCLCSAVHHPVVARTSADSRYKRHSLHSNSGTQRTTYSRCDDRSARAHRPGPKDHRMSGTSAPSSIEERLAK